MANYFQSVIASVPNDDTLSQEGLTDIFISSKIGQSIRTALNLRPVKFNRNAVSRALDGFRYTDVIDVRLNGLPQVTNFYADFLVNFEKYVADIIYFASKVLPEANLYFGRLAASKGYLKPILDEGIVGFNKLPALEKASEAMEKIAIPSKTGRTETTFGDIFQSKADVLSVIELLDSFNQRIDTQARPTQVEQSVLRIHRTLDVLLKQVANSDVSVEWRDHLRNQINLVANYTEWYAAIVYLTASMSNVVSEALNRLPK